MENRAALFPARRDVDVEIEHPLCVLVRIEERLLHPPGGLVRLDDAVLRSASDRIDAELVVLFPVLAHLFLEALGRPRLLALLRVEELRREEVVATSECA